MKYKVVIFDFDYTLGDSTQGIVLSINYALKKLGWPASTTEKVKMTVGHSLEEAYFQLTGDTDNENVNQFSIYFKEKADIVMTENTVLLPGTIEVFRFFKKENIKIGIVTTKYHYRINQILNKFNAEKYVDIIVGAEDVKSEKPNPEGLLSVITSFNLEREEIVFIGDSLVDAETAKRAGVKFVAVTTGTTAPNDFRKYPCATIINKLQDLLEPTFIE